MASAYHTVSELTVMVIVERTPLIETLCRSTSTCRPVERISRPGVKIIGVWAVKYAGLHNFSFSHRIFYSGPAGNLPSPV